MPPPQPPPATRGGVAANIGGFGVDRGGKLLIVCIRVVGTSPAFQRTRRRGREPGDRSCFYSELAGVQR
jgi:hypothetical protein